MSDDTSANTNDKANIGKLIDNLVGALIPERYELCIRCRRPRPMSNAEVEATWTLQSILTFPIGLLCPNCRTVEEQAEVMIRSATNDITCDDGRVIQRPKPMDDDENDQGHPRTA